MFGVVADMRVKCKQNILCRTDKWEKEEEESVMLVPSTKTDRLQTQEFPGSHDLSFWLK